MSGAGGLVTDPPGALSWARKVHIAGSDRPDLRPTYALYNKLKYEYFLVIEPSCVVYPAVREPQRAKYRVTVNVRVLRYMRRVQSAPKPLWAYCGILGDTGVRIRKKGEKSGFELVKALREVMESRPPGYEGCQPNSTPTPNSCSKTLKWHVVMCSFVESLVWPPNTQPSVVIWSHFQLLTWLSGVFVLCSSTTLGDT